MNKKLKIAIGIAVAIILIVIIINIKNNNSTKEITEIETTISEIKYDEENEEYYIEDTATGEILHTANSEEELRIYTIDPDYDPQNPDAVDEYEYYEDMGEN